MINQSTCVTCFYSYCVPLPGKNAPVAQPRQQYIFTHLGTRDGLASDEVMAVTQDRKGFMWIATINGLQRYDGNRFLSFRHNPKDPRTIPDNIILHMQADKQGRLWLLFSENRVGYLDNNDFIFHQVPVRMNSDLLRTGTGCFFSDNSGRIMLGIAKSTILAYDATTNEFSVEQAPFRVPNLWKPAWVTQDRNDNYWIACDSGLVKYNPPNKQLSYRGHNAGNDEIIRSYADLLYVSYPFFDSLGRFWITSWHPQGFGPYLFSYDTKTKKRKEWEKELSVAIKMVYHEVRQITEEQDGTLWIAGLNLFARLDPGASSFEIVQNNLPGEFSIRYDMVKNLFQDQEKNIWVSTNKGLFRFNPLAQLFQVIQNRRPGPKDTIYTPDVSDIIQTRSGEILANTWGNGLFAYDSSFKPLPLKYVEEGLNLGDGLNWCIYQRSNGDIWRGCQEGLIVITHGDDKVSENTRPPVLENSTVRQIVEDRKGNLWLGSHRGRLVKWDAATNTFKLIIGQLSTIYRLYIDRRGDLWVCTGNKGVFHIDTETGTIIANYTSGGPSGKKLMGLGSADIIQYDDSTYVIASGCLNFLNRNTGQIGYYDAERGLPSNSVNNLIMDRQGLIWLTTDSRLCRFNLKTSVLNIFSEEDGIPASTFNVASANILRDGRIAIGRTHDFIVFSPERMVFGNLKAPPVEITGVMLMNTRLSMDSLNKLPEVRLRYNENSMIIEFSTLTYLNAFAISYKMENLDKDWIRTQPYTRQAVYSYLPPGKYTFQIKCFNGEGLESAVTTMEISVRAPFWRTWWFYSFMALLIAAVFYWDDRVKIRRKEALQKMRSEIAGNLHEEINKALNNINMLSEIARIKADKEPEQSQSYINEIHSKSHNMIIAMDDMLWSIDPANDNMGRTIQRIREFADALRHRHDTLINLQTDEKVEKLKPDMKIRHEVMMIYKLALRLLVEEMKAPQTSIHLNYLKSHLQLNIYTPLKKLPDNNNIVMKMIGEMKERAASIHSVLEIQSDEKGTAIILAVRA